MTTVANASVVFKDKNGNVGTVKGASANDITKISNAISDVAQVVNPTTHLPIQATTSSVGVVQLADSAAVAAGTSGRVVDAAQLKAVADSIPSVSNVVDLSSAQTISGVKTFSVLPQSSVTPISNDDLVNKAYVDAQSGGGGLGAYVPGQIIVSSIPQTDARLHLADGSLLSGTGTYADFVSYMADLYADDPTNACFTTEANWQASVTTYGECGKFVYDSVNNTLRLPKLTSFVQATSTAAELGSLVEAGAPNISGTFVPSIHAVNAASTGRLGVGNSTFASGAFNTDLVQTFAYFNNGLVSTTQADTRLNFNASKSNSIYGNSNTIQPQAIKYYFYIVIGTVSKTDIQIDIDNVLTDLNGKADVDFANINNTAKIAITHNAMPSDVYDDLTLGASGSTYTAPADGYFYLDKLSSASGQYMDIASAGIRVTIYASASSQNLRTFLPAKKGESIIVRYSLAGTTEGNTFFRFVYAVGSESEKA